MPKDPVPASADRLPDAWCIAMADLLEAVDGGGFAVAFRRVLALCCGFDSLVVTRYDGASQPEALFQDLDDVQAAITVTFYATGPYLMDPVYQACRNGADAGVHRLRDIATRAFYRSEYYRSFYRKIRIGDEIAILIPEGRERWLVLSLARRRHRPYYTEADRATLARAFPVIRAAALRHWGAGTARVTPAGAGAEDRLSLFGSDRLSLREAEVVQLILKGHSTPTAADALGISPGTVKVHRRHAYAKLNVSSQAELFSQAARYLLQQAD